MSTIRVLLLLALQAAWVAAAVDEDVAVALEEDAKAAESCTEGEAASAALELRQLRHARVVVAAAAEGGTTSSDSSGSNIVSEESSSSRGSEGRNAKEEEEPAPELAAAVQELPSNESLQAHTQWAQFGNSIPTQFQWGPNNGYCLSTDGNRMGNGVKVHLWDCAADFDSSGQVWTRPVGGQQSLIRAYFNSDYCLVVDGNRYFNGAKIQLWRCDPSNPHQYWTYTPSGYGATWLLQPANQYSNFMSYCLVVDGNQAFDGAKIQLWDCGSDLGPKTWKPFSPHGRR